MRGTGTLPDFQQEGGAAMDAIWKEYKAFFIGIAVVVVMTTMLLQITKLQNDVVWMKLEIENIVEKVNVS